MIERASNLVSLGKKDSTITNAANCLINIQAISYNFYLFKDEVDRHIDQLVKDYKTRHFDNPTLSKLEHILSRTELGKFIREEHKAFDQYKDSKFREKTKKHGIDYVLNNLAGTDLEMPTLYEKYREFNETYQGLVHEHLDITVNLSSLISNLKALTQHSRNIRSVDFALTKGEINKIPNLLAHIAAIWTLKKADRFFEALDPNEKENYLFQPHAAQIISIFRMLGIGDSKQEFRNNLVQVGTGEGKSVTLAFSEALLALLGFDINIACYSEYLSKRDHEAFQSLLDLLDVKNVIHYGTFNQLCEGCINENTNIRKEVEYLVSNNSFF